MRYFYLLAVSLFFVACGASDEQSQSKLEAGEEEVNAIEEQATDNSSEEVNTKITENMLTKFVPKGYKIVQWEAGNLNMDDKDDVILVIGKAEDEAAAESTGSTDYSTNEEERPLLILIMNEKGELEEKARNKKIIMCPDCGGVMGDPFAEAGSIVIKNGYFSIESMGGSSDRWVRIITFRYKTDKKAWFLHKDGMVSWSTHKVNSEEETVYSTKDFGVVPFEKYNYINQF